jgi:hypothetical protein
MHSSSPPFVLHALPRQHPHNVKFTTLFLPTCTQTKATGAKGEDGVPLLTPDIHLTQVSIPVFWCISVVTLPDLLILYLFQYSDDGGYPSQALLNNRLASNRREGLGMVVAITRLMVLKLLPKSITLQYKRKSVQRHCTCFLISNWLCYLGNVIQSCSIDHCLLLCTEQEWNVWPVTQISTNSTFRVWAHGVRSGIFLNMPPVQIYLGRW